jgi:general secretion pathway protein E
MTELSDNKPVGSFIDWLLAQGKLSAEAVERAQRSANQVGERIVPVLTKLGLMQERPLAVELSLFHKVLVVTREDFPQQPLYADRINRRFLQLHHMLPMAEEAHGLIVAMADPGDEDAARAMALFAQRPILRRVAPLTDIGAAIDKLYGNDGSGVAAGQEMVAEQDKEDISHLSDLASEAPVIRLVHGMIAEAVQTGVSDIHIEPFVDRIRVRYRVDGLLREQESHPVRLGSAITSRLKIMAKLNIAERRMPQDGSIRFTVEGKQVDLRISTSPTVYGESVVLRILDRDNLTLDFQALGFDVHVLKPLLELLHKPNGILLVTGPTGSGKTTTLYTALTLLNTAEKKILTIEDPIEYKLDGTNQQEVLPQIHRSFASALRSFLRQDPDVLMVGEIRDSETAQTSVQAALTGHLVLSTLHTNDAASAMTRLLDMGIADYLIASTVTGVLGQRLIRKLCPKCKQAYTPVPDMVAHIYADHPAQAKTPVLYHPKGCEACRGSGFRGRTMVVELLTVHDAIRQMILKKAGAKDIQRAAVTGGMRTMYQHGLAKAVAGETSFEEVLRVTQEV